MGKLTALAIGTDSSNRKVAFHELVEKAFDETVEKYGKEPEALVFFMGGLKSHTGERTQWTMFGDAYEAPFAMLAKAVACLQRDVIDPD